ncbi:MAG TPA: hypothetical protein VFW40_00850 [Capsulimonadaceae bacterium]|nr:hypothetical protein [Capsulimonadaceae bacterium]
MNERDRERRRRQQQTIQNLLDHGLPVTAEERIEGLKSASQPLFTSNLAPGDLLLMEKCRCRPIAQVAGANVYNISWLTNPRREGGRMEHLSTVHWLGQVLAVARIQEEARRLNAHCVVGTRIVKLEKLGGDLTHGYEALGTAVEFLDEPLPQQPYVCTLNADELWSLREAGFQPVGFVLGNCDWYQVAGLTTMMANRDTASWGYDTSRNNQELVDYTKGLSNARQDAMQRLSQECLKAGGSGVLNTQLCWELERCPVEIPTNARRIDMVISASISGTAVAQRSMGKIPAINYAQVVSG